MAKGIGGMPGNMQDMMKQAQKMQKELLEAQQEAEKLEEEGSAGGGMIIAVANGAGKLMSIKIEKDVIDPEDPDMLQDLVLAAANSALENAQEKVKSKMAKITGGMNIPGM